MLLPAADDDSREFWAWCAKGQLRMQRCAACGRWRFPPRPMCPSCRSFTATWERVSGRGRIWSYVIAHPPLLPWYAEQAPYNVIVVTLDEDPTLRMVGNLVAAPDGRLDEIDPHSIEIGEPVEAVFLPIDEGLALPRWVRVTR
ncbi:MAG: OB-fold domain-containing protein [Acidimicrobiales bacterium]|nr:OB-fold domain-containing protein [Acidimicrobiales bacterium]